MRQNSANIPEELILQALQTVLGYEGIRNSPTLAKFLEYIVLETLSGHQEEIKEYTIAVKALGRSHDFNPQLDAMVRIHAGRLRRVINHYYQENGQHDRVVISIPKGSYIPAFELNGFKKEELPAEQVMLPSLHQHPAPPPGQNYTLPMTALAILPLHNLSPHEDTSTFLVVLGELLGSGFAHFEHISVISYYASFPFDSPAKDLQEWEKRADLDFLLTGSIQLIRSVLRLTIQLIQNESREIVWAETYSRHFEPDNNLNLEEDLASLIINAIADENGILLKLQKLPAWLPAGTSVSTILRAVNEYYNLASPFEAQQSRPVIASLEKALEKEPSNALVAAMLAELYLFSYLNNATPDTALLEKAITLAHAAVRGDKYCQHAQRSLAWAQLFGGKKEQCLETMELCLVLNAKAASTISVIGLLYVCLGNYTKGYKFLLQSTHLKPVIPAFSKLGFALFFYAQGRYQESLTWVKRLDAPNAPFVNLLDLALQGKISKAKQQKVSDTLKALKPHARQVIGRLVLDTKLRSQLVQDICSAGLAV